MARLIGDLEVQTDNKKQRSGLFMKKTLITIGCVGFYLTSVFGGAIFGYNVGYDDAMVEVETRVLEGIETMGDLFNVEGE